MMQCEVIQDLLPLYVDNCCSEVSREIVGEHLEQCEECRKFAESLKTELSIDRDEKDLYIQEENLLKNSRKAMKKEVKKDYFAKAVHFDIPVNLIIVFYFLYRGILDIQAGYYEMPMSEEFIYGFAIYRWLGMVLVAFWTIFDVIFFVKNKKEKAGLISWMMSGLSILSKILVIMICGIIWLCLRL